MAGCFCSISRGWFYCWQCWTENYCRAENGSFFYDKSKSLPSFCTPNGLFFFLFCGFIADYVKDHLRVNDFFSSFKGRWGIYEELKTMLPLKQLALIDQFWYWMHEIMLPAVSCLSFRQMHFFKSLSPWIKQQHTHQIIVTVWTFGTGALLKTGQDVTYSVFSASLCSLFWFILIALISATFCCCRGEKRHG